MPPTREVMSDRAAGLSRRSLLTGGLAAFGLTSMSLLAACSTGSTKSASGSGSKKLTFSTPTDAVATIELFKDFAASFEKANKGTSVSVIENGAGNFDQWFQAHLAAKNAPDTLRITPTQIGTYIANGGMLDIAPYLPKNYGDDFNPTFWSQVSQGGKVFGIPQCVDTTAMFYRTSMLQQVGARIPSSPKDAWTWDEFIDICTEVKKITGKYAFSFQWSTGAGYYWLPVLYQHGGQLMKSDFKTPAITSDEGIEALEWTRKWFTDGLISPDNTLQGTVGDAAINLFSSGQVGMMVNGDWKMTNVQAGGLKDEDWDVTYLFRDKNTASLVGGTIIGVSRDADNPELAARLAQWICDTENMKKYCEQTLFLPSRTSLRGDKTQYSYRPELVSRFLDQAAAIPQEMYKLQTSKSFSAINNVVSQQIPLCFTGQQTAKETAQNIASGITSAIATA